MDGTSLVMFIIPIVMAFAFSFGGIFSDPSETDPVNMAGFLCSLVGAICWLISAFTWAMLATMEALVWISWLWFGLFFVLISVTVYRGFSILRESVAKRKQPDMLEIRQREPGE